MRRQSDSTFGSRPQHRASGSGPQSPTLSNRGFNDNNASFNRNNFGSLSSNAMYKTELCRSFIETGFCCYYEKCQFAHGEVELRVPLNRPANYKTELCRAFHSMGTCPYGTRCRFIHSIESEGRNYHGRSSSPSVPVGSSHSFSMPGGGSSHTDMVQNNYRDVNVASGLGNGSIPPKVSILHRNGNHIDSSSLPTTPVGHRASVSNFSCPPTPSVQSQSFSTPGHEEYLRQSSLPSAMVNDFSGEDNNDGGGQIVDSVLLDLGIVDKVQSQPLSSSINDGNHNGLEVLIDGIPQQTSKQVLSLHAIHLDRVNNDEKLAHTSLPDCASCNLRGGGCCLNREIMLTCYACKRDTCGSCARTCDECSNSFCHFDCTLNYDENTERTHCFGCHNTYTASFNRCSNSTQWLGPEASSVVGIESSTRSRNNSNSTVAESSMHSTVERLVKENFNLQAQLSYLLQRVPPSTPNVAFDDTTSSLNSGMNNMTLQRINVQATPIIMGGNTASSFGLGSFEESVGRYRAVGNSDGADLSFASTNDAVISRSLNNTRGGADHSSSNGAPSGQLEPPVGSRSSLTENANDKLKGVRMALSFVLEGESLGGLSRKQLETLQEQLHVAHGKVHAAVSLKE